MSTPDEHPAELSESALAVPTTGEETVRYAGLVTRMVSWVVDALLINLAAIFAGIGIALVAAIFPITKDLKPLFVAIAAVVYALWTAAYFVTFWSTTGQTPGARFMQVRLVTPTGGTVKPVRAFVRWIGMNLAMVPLPWGFMPIPFGRLGFPDWLAHTRVIEITQLSIPAQRLERLRQAREGSRRSPYRPSSPAPDNRDPDPPRNLASHGDELASQDAGSDVPDDERPPRR